MATKLAVPQWGQEALHNLAQPPFFKKSYDPQEITTTTKNPKGTLYSMDPRTQDQGPRDPGTQGPRDPGTRDPWNRIGIHFTCTYIVHVSLIAPLECTMEWTMRTVGGTFVLAALSLSTLSDISRDPFTAGKVYRTVSIEHIKYAHDLWPQRLWGGCMNRDPVQGRAGYEWVTR